LLTHYGDSVKLYAGGTELLLLLKAGLLQYEHLVNIKTIPALNAICYRNDDHVLIIGALATHREIELSSVVQRHFSLLAELESSIGNVRVRNTGTIGGNLCFAEPHSDPATLLLALGAQLKLQRSSAERILSLDQFILGSYETVLHQDELLTEIRIPLPSSKTGGAYQRFQFHERPTVSVAVFLTLDGGEEGIKDAKIAVGCVNTKPLRATEAEACLRGKDVDQAGDFFPEAGRLAARITDPTDDLDGPRDYKKHLVEVFVRRALQQALHQFPRGQATG